MLTHWSCVLLALTHRYIAVVFDSELFSTGVTQLHSGLCISCSWVTPVLCGSVSNIARVFCCFSIISIYIYIYVCVYLCEHAWHSHTYTNHTDTQYMFTRVCVCVCVCGGGGGGALTHITLTHITHIRSHIYRWVSAGKCNSIAHALELRLSRTDPSICTHVAAEPTIVYHIRYICLNNAVKPA